MKNKKGILFLLLWITIPFLILYFYNNEKEENINSYLSNNESSKIYHLNKDNNKSGVTINNKYTNILPLKYAYAAEKNLLIDEANNTNLNNEKITNGKSQTLAEPVSTSINSGKVEDIQAKEYKNKKNISSIDFKITAYDLSYNSCNKTSEHPEYGLTASGFNLEGLSREEAMVVAADPSVLPMGTKLQIEFYDENYKQYDGQYTVKDTGGAVKGHVLDVFLGDFESYTPHKSVQDFGITAAKVTIIS